MGMVVMGEREEEEEGGGQALSERRDPAWIFPFPAVGISRNPERILPWTKEREAGNPGVDPIAETDA